MNPSDNSFYKIYIKGGERAYAENNQFVNRMLNGGD